MKCVIVTSDVTYIPRNYSDFTKRLAENDHVVGLILISNNSPRLILKGLALCTMGAHKIGTQLMFNSAGALKINKNDSRILDFTTQGKWIAKIKDINDWQNNAILAKNLVGIDLIVNARTRCIYRKPILNLPKYGCVNIHHGILPNYRGTMCDFYALTEGRTPGFSIHSMNEKIDDGKILKVVERPWQSKNYFNYLDKSGTVEANALLEVFNEIENKNALPEGILNCPTQKIYTKNPTQKTLNFARRNGYKLITSSILGVSRFLSKLLPYFAPL
jgi:methionyl-tRNA formyltransferase